MHSVNICKRPFAYRVNLFVEWRLYVSVTAKEYTSVWVLESPLYPEDVKAG